MPTITRTQAARLLELLRRASHSAETIPAATLRAAFAELGIPPLEPCEGEAHSNPHIDHCSGCAPRWGWRGEPIKVR